MFTVLSALVALGCVLASARRLAAVASMTWLDPRLLVRELRAGDAGRSAALLRAIAACDGASWERAVLGALATVEPNARAALVNEQLRELDWSAQRWARAPRVCASVASSAGFLFGCAAVLRAANDGDASAAADLVPALDAAAIGIAGACFCVAVHLRCRRMVRERLAAADTLVDCLEARAPLPGEPPPGDTRPKPAAMCNI